jgi:hypothetical protein
MFARAFSSFIENRLHVVDFSQNLCHLLQGLMVGSRRMVVVMMVVWVSSNVMVMVD